MLHVALLDRLENSLDDGRSDPRSEAKATGMNAQIITATVNSLMKIVKALTWKKAESEWSNYGSRSHYTRTIWRRRQRLSSKPQSECRIASPGTLAAMTDTSRR